MLFDYINFEDINKDTQINILYQRFFTQYFWECSQWIDVVLVTLE